MATKSLREYLDDYAEGHRQLGTRLTHMVGIPLIVASVPVLPFNPLLGGGMFAAGWALQFVGHYCFEKNSPLLFGDLTNTLVGVVWAAKEWADLFGIELPLPASATASAAS
ncbi:MAG TPA: DUF962 domain-containing protein [Polyangia bacterium]|jgi:uncharacterized membrane protein YGL010W|nr:DUF962 domain-containing protein [Polyangia bacterium]HWE30698.1 DUF962 domain-containing protein [Polyangia bacterium]